MPSPRCSKCCQLGHNRRYCKQNDSDAFAMSVSYYSARLQVSRLKKEKIQSEVNKLRSEMVLQSIRRPDIIETQDSNGNIVFVPNDSLLSQNNKYKITPTRPMSLIKIQEILFDNSQDLSDGLYKQLMDALIIKD